MLALRDLRTLPWQVCEGREALMGELSPGRCDFHLPPPPNTFIRTNLPDTILPFA